MKRFYKQKSVQDIQDEIFRKMSAEESVRLWGKFYQFAKVLNKLGENYDGKDGTRRFIEQNREHSR